MTLMAKVTNGWRAPAAVLVAAGFLALAGDGLAQTASGRGPLVLTGQGNGRVLPPEVITGSIPQGAARTRTSQFGFTQPSPPKEWSGEDGASGHPLMTADAIRQAAANFPYCVANLWPDAARRNISRDSFDRYTAGLTPDLRIMDFVDAQPEFTKAVWDYLDILVTDERLARGREILAIHRPVFDAMEKAYGVDRFIVAAIWGIESNYSTKGGDRSVLRSTATLACVGRRQAYFKDEFLSALEILHRGDRDAVYADGVQEERDRRRRRRTARHRRFSCRHRRLHCQQVQEGRLEERRDLGLRGRGAAQLQLRPRRPVEEHDHRAVGKARHSPRGRQAVPETDRHHLPAGAGRCRRTRLPDAA
jgi:hypothetical protein